MAVSSFLRQHDTIVNEILTDYLNLAEPPPDTSRGSMPYIFANVLASQSYGLNAKLNFIANQIGPIPSTDGAFLDRYGEVYALPKFVGESNGDYYNRIISRLQNPPSGGNKKDYEVWALDQSLVNVTNPNPDPLTFFNAIVTIRDAFPIPGRVTVYTIPNDETIIFDPAPSFVGTNTSVVVGKLVDAGATFVTNGILPGFRIKNTSDSTEAIVLIVDSETELSLDTDIFTATPKNYLIDTFEELLREETFTYIETQRPLAILTTNVVSAKPTDQPIVVDVTAGPDFDRVNTENEIIAYGAKLAPNEPIFASQITCICIENGALSANVTTPAIETTNPAEGKFFRITVVTINEL